MIEFKQIELAFDEAGYERELKIAENSALELTDKFNRIGEFLNMEMGGKEVMNVMDLGMNYIDSFVIPQFQFPKADKEFNLKSMGMLEEYDNIKGIARTISNKSFDGYGFDFVEGAVVLPQIGKDKIREKYKKYTKNQKQNDMYNQTLKVCDELNKLGEFNVYGITSHYAIERAVSLIDVGTVGKEYYFKVHISRLLDIR